MIMIEYREGSTKVAGDKKSINIKIQNEQVRVSLKKRNLMILNDRMELPTIISNITIIKLAEEFVKEKEEKLRIYNKINHVRLQKKMIILAELVGIRGMQSTQCFDNINEVSLIKWKIQFLIVKKLSIGVVRKQNQFKQWLITKLLYIVYNFKAFGESRIKVTTNLRFIKCKVNTNIQCYKRVNKESNEF